jgi:ADP-heptose:LPS heptosyltransferase
MIPKSNNMFATRSVQRAIDRYFGGAICLLIWLFRKLFKKNNRILTNDVRKIACIKLWAIGESVLILPMLHEIHQIYPKATIDVICTPQNSEVFTQLLYINRVRIYSLWRLLSLIFKSKEYDLVFDAEPFFCFSALLTWRLAKYSVGFSHGVRSHLYDRAIKYNDSQHIVQTYCDMLVGIGIGTPPKPAALQQLAFTNNDSEYINKLLVDVPSDASRIVFSAGSGPSNPERRWASENFISLGRRLISSSNAKIILIGGKDEVSLNSSIAEELSFNCLDLTSKLSLKQLFALLKVISVFVGNDSGPMHISAAQGAPTIGLFGPNTPVRFAPFGKSNVSIYHNTEIPIINVHRGKFGTKQERANSAIAMQHITVDEVYFTVMNLLESIN